MCVSACEILLSLIRPIKIIIDWHNLAYTLLAISLGSETHWLCRFARWYEGFFARRAQAHFCVTDACMHAFLILCDAYVKLHRLDGRACPTASF